MSNNAIQVVTDKLSVIFAATDVALNKWADSNKNGNLQFPTLLAMLAVDMNWDDKQIRENDPIVRYYVRNNPEWHVTRGAHGGIMKASAKHQKETERLAREAAKESARATIDSKTSP